MKNNYGLPGPNPPRNAAGGFKVVGLGAYERINARTIGAGTGPIVLGKGFQWPSPAPYDFKPAKLISKARLPTLAPIT